MALFERWWKMISLKKILPDFSDAIKVNSAKTPLIHLFDDTARKMRSIQFIWWVECIFCHQTCSTNFLSVLMDKGQVSAVVFHYTVLNKKYYNNIYVNMHWLWFYPETNCQIFSQINARLEDNLILAPANISPNSALIEISVHNQICANRLREASF